MNTRSTTPKGPGGSWKTGQRVPYTGWWRNNFGQQCHFAQGATFPPRTGYNHSTKVGSAFWLPMDGEETAATVLF
jgi:hypothetical protein